MKLYYEWGTRQLRKHGEELCGDSIAVTRHADSVTLALSDGLGSGVKANILATLTTQIAMRMLEDNLSLGEVVQTLSETLPVCAVRKVAYSTFAIAQFFSQGTARVVEFDSPPPILLRGRKVQPVDYEERRIDGKTIHEAVLELADGDWVVFLSDGVLNAGIGGVYPLGWGWEQAAQFLEKHAHRDLSAEDLAGKVAEAVGGAVRRPPRRRREHRGHQGAPQARGQRAHRTALPAGRQTGSGWSSFTHRLGQRVVCGGTTAKIVARQMGQALEVDLATITAEVPPLARLPGVDLVTEGILTLTRVRDLLAAGTDRAAVRFQVDGASSLLRLLLGVDHVHFLVGQAVNPAHQNPDLPHQLGIRVGVVREIVEELRQRGTEVTVEEI